MGNEHSIPPPVYIVGRRHSGTTFLDVLLGSTDEIDSFGEIVTGLHSGLDEPLASGGTLGTSEFWNSARDHYHRSTGRNLLDDGKFLYTLSNIKYFFHAMASSLDKQSRWGRYAELNRDLINTLSACSDGSRVLDSNKEYTRGLMFLKSIPDAKILHILRNPVQIAGSHYFRVREKNIPIGFMKTHFHPGPFLFVVLMVTVGISWSVGLAVLGLMKLRYPGRILDVSYEKFCDNPADELARIGKFLDIDTSNVAQGIAENKAFPVMHNIGGNELRMEGSFTFIPNSSGRRQLPKLYQWGITLFALPGYLFKWLFVRL